MICVRVVACFVRQRRANSTQLRTWCISCELLAARRDKPALIASTSSLVVARHARQMIGTGICGRRDTASHPSECLLVAVAVAAAAITMINVSICSSIRSVGGTPHVCSDTSITNTDANKNSSSASHVSARFQFKIITIRRNLKCEMHRLLMVL